MMIIYTRNKCMSQNKNAVWNRWPLKGLRHKLGKSEVITTVWCLKTNKRNKNTKSSTNWRTKKYTVLSQISDIPLKLYLLYQWFPNSYRGAENQVSVCRGGEGAEGNSWITAAEDIRGDREPSGPCRRSALPPPPSKWKSQLPFIVSGCFYGFYL